MPREDRDHPGDPISVSNPPRWTPRRYEVAIEQAEVWMSMRLSVPGTMYWKGVRDALAVLSGKVVDRGDVPRGALIDIDKYGPAIAILLMIQRAPHGDLYGEVDDGDEQSTDQAADAGLGAAAD